MQPKFVPVKKALALIILASFLFNTSGYLYLFEFDEYLAHREMKTAFRTGKFKITILLIPGGESNPEFRNIGSNEFVFQDRIYDYIEKTRTGNDLLFKCVFDEREQKLISGLDKIHEHKSHPDLTELQIKDVWSGQALTMQPPCGQAYSYHVTNTQGESAALPGLSPPPKIRS